MDSLITTLQADKRKLLKLIGDFKGDEDIYAWCRATMDLLFKKVLFLNDVCLTGKMLAGLHNLYYYFDKFRDDEDCVNYLAISLYMIGIESGALRFGDPIETFSFFFNCIDKDNWKSDVQGDDINLLLYDLEKLEALKSAWYDGEDLPLFPIGLQTAASMSVYLNYKY